MAKVANTTFHPRLSIVSFIIIGKHNPHHVYRKKDWYRPSSSYLIVCVLLLHHLSTLRGYLGIPVPTTYPNKMFVSFGG